MATETDMGKRCRSMAEDLRHGILEVNPSDVRRLLILAGNEIDRYYNGMMNWKATAEAKDRDYVVKLDKESKL